MEAVVIRQNGRRHQLQNHSLLLNGKLINALQSSVERNESSGRRKISGRTTSNAHKSFVHQASNGRIPKTFEGSVSWRDLRTTAAHSATVKVKELNNNNMLSKEME